MSPKSETKVQHKKYYAQRYNLWSKYDDGVQMDEESWYSSTPENIARRIADLCANRYAIRTRASEKSCIIDCFCGTGANAIQFALGKFDRVVAIDINPEKVAMARNNAQIYGVAGKIEFICGDVFEIVPHLMTRFRDSTEERLQLIFLSPPWGGPSYIVEKIFDVSAQISFLGDFVQLCRTMTHNIVAYMPRNLSIEQAALLGTGATEEIFSLEYFTAAFPKVKATAVFFYDERITERSRRKISDNKCIAMNDAVASTLLSEVKRSQNALMRKESEKERA